MLALVADSTSDQVGGMLKVTSQTNLDTRGQPGNAVHTGLLDAETHTETFS